MVRLAPWPHSPTPRFVCAAALLALAACNGLLGIDDATVGQGPAGQGGQGGGGGGGGSFSGGGGSSPGGGGAGGAPSCAGDGACAAEGEGAFCVAGVCTKSAATCDKSKRVVIDNNRRAPSGEGFADACYFEALDGALKSPQAGMHVIVTAEAASAGAPLNLALDGITLEGQASLAGQPLPLSIAPLGTSPLVALSGDGLRLKGFALGGDGTAPGVVVASGRAAIEGPFRVRGFAPALSVEGEAKATIAGTKAAPVAFTENALGLRVGATAGLELSGEGGESVTVEKTSKGAGVLVDAGPADKGGLTMSGVSVRANAANGGEGGIGGVEVREGRTTVISNNVFDQNLRALSLRAQGVATISENAFTKNSISALLDGQERSSADAFAGVIFAGNDLSQALSANDDEGVALCGYLLGAGDTTLKLGAGNIFPSGRQTTPDLCQELNASQEGSCDTGADIGFSGGSNGFVVTCVM